MTRLLYRCCFTGFLFLMMISAAKADLAKTISQIKPSIVGVGTYSRLFREHSRILGTGFAIMNGQFIATCAHVVPDVLDSEKKEKLVVFIGKGESKAEVRNAQVSAIDSVHDIAILTISGPPLPPLALSTSTVREGESIAFTGFPIGGILGLYPVTHHGIVSSITPVVIPARTSTELTIQQVKQLRDPYKVYQLDAVAYPGNSGSPVYRPDNGDIIAVINQVLVRGTKEAALTNPTAITYSIPIRYLRAMVRNLED